MPSARPRVVSEDGATGPLQIRPETERQAARKLYATGYNFGYVNRDRLQFLQAEDLKEPVMNILIDCYLLDRYNAASRGRLARTIGAWNAGPAVRSPSRTRRPCALLLRSMPSVSFSAVGRTVSQP